MNERRARSETLKQVTTLQNVGGTMFNDERRHDT